LKFNARVQRRPVTFNMAINHEVRFGFDDVPQARANQADGPIMCA
jgi:hypothetical protein